MKKLTEWESKKILEKYKIPVTKEFLAKGPSEAVDFANKIGFPVVMKVMSKDILHKTDANCILTDVNSDMSVLKGFNTLLDNAKKYDPKAEIEGILVQETVSGEGIRECIIGSKKDQQFGPVLMFGSGGILVEILKDVTFRIIPIERKDAKEMIEEIKGYPILQGVRGQKPVNFSELENILLKVSEMVWEEKNIEELDINPLFVDEKKAIAIDARMVLSD